VGSIPMRYRHKTAVIASRWLLFGRPLPARCQTVANFPLRKGRVQHQDRVPLRTRRQMHVTHRGRRLACPASSLIAIFIANATVSSLLKKYLLRRFV
jgi:hypothetical protein